MPDDLSLIYFAAIIILYRTTVKRRVCTVQNTCLRSEFI